MDAQTVAFIKKTAANDPEATSKIDKLLETSMGFPCMLSKALGGEEGWTVPNARYACTALTVWHLIWLVQEPEAPH